METVLPQNKFPSAVKNLRMSHVDNFAVLNVSANIWLSVVCALTQPGGVLNPAPMPTPATNFARPVDSKVRRWSNGKLTRGVPDP